MLIARFNLTDPHRNKHLLYARRLKGGELMLQLASHSGTPESLSNMQALSPPPAFCRPDDSATVVQIEGGIHTTLYALTDTERAPSAAAKES